MVDIKVPSFGESVSEATVAAIFKETGSYVERDEEILELESDKASAPLTAPASGVINLNVNVDDVLSIGQVIGTIDESAKPSSKPPEKLPTETPKAPEPPPPIPSQSSARSTPEQFVASLSEPKAPSPCSEPCSTPPSTPSPTKTPEGHTRKKMSGLRKTIAKRLVEAKNTTAMLTTFNEVDMTEIMKIRSKEKDKFLEKNNVKLGFMSFFIKACVSALNEYPDVNSYIDGTDIVTPNFINIGVAVSSNKGLTVPVVKNSAALTFAQIESAIREYALKARDGKISISDLQDGTFTITNGGTFGSLLSTPILNLPQSAILGMHAIKERPMAVNGNVEIRPMMYLALSYDHRIIDGKEAVSFLVHIKDNLEDPSKLLLDF